MKLSQTIELPKLLDFGATASLTEELRKAAQSKARIILEASQVLRASTVAVQLLLVFIRQCRADGLDIFILAPSEFFSNAINSLGLADSFAIENTETSP